MSAGKQAAAAGQAAAADDQDPRARDANVVASVTLQAIGWKWRLIIIGVGVALLALCIVGMAATTVIQSSTAVWPVPVKPEENVYSASGWTITSGFGWRWHPKKAGVLDFHSGIDLAQGPFCDGCPLPAIFDADVRYVGWDPNVLASGRDPRSDGGGQMVILDNRPRDEQTNASGQYEIEYAHLQPYRLYLQLQGRIDDPWQRAEYAAYSNYQPLGVGPLLVAEGLAYSVECKQKTATGYISPPHLPLALEQIGNGTWEIQYDRPLKCRAIISWPRYHKRGWQGWTPDDGQVLTTAADRVGVYHEWETPVSEGVRAGDVALRFRAHITPPPPPATATPEVTNISLPLPRPTRAPASLPTWQAQRTSSGGRTLDGAAASSPVAEQAMANTPDCRTTFGGALHCTWRLEPGRSDVEHRHLSSRQQASRPIDNEGGTAGGHELSLVRQVPPQPTAAPAAEQASVEIRPLDSQPIAAGGRATWTATLRSNQRGFWGMLFTNATSSGYDGRLSITARANESVVACETTTSASGKRTLCTQPAAGDSTLVVTITIYNSGITSFGDVVQLYITDVDEGGSGYLVASADLRIGRAPAATPPPTASPAALTSTPTPTAAPSKPDCRKYPFVHFSDIAVSAPQLIQPAAYSFAAVRRELKERAGGYDLLAVLSDMYRSPGFRSGQEGNGVAYKSWHKAGRAIDLNLGNPLLEPAPEGRYFRVWLNAPSGRRIDVTQILEKHGWSRIPRQGNGHKQKEWWHYEYHPDNISWESAMLQAHSIAILKQAFPDVDWQRVGCTENSQTSPPARSPTGEACIPGVPSYSRSVEYLAGCGPPVLIGTKVKQLDTTLGFVGMSGSTSGPHLHLGIRQRAWVFGSWNGRNICDPNPQWLPPNLPTPTAASSAWERQRQCWSDYADPLDFLPRSHRPLMATAVPGRPTPTIVGPDEPFQLPPPGQGLLITPPPGAPRPGQYWNPNRQEGRYGGDAGWLCALLGIACGQ